MTEAAQCSSCGEALPDDSVRFGATMCSTCARRRPSLTHYLTSTWFFRVVEKGWFGRKRIRFGASLFICSFLCETGAILGRARRDELELLASMFTKPGTENVAVQMCHGLAKRQLELYAGEPECTFWEFILRSELAVLGVEDPYQWLLAHGDSKLPLDGPWERAQKSLLTGIGLGALYPDLVEAMCRQTYEQLPSEGEQKWLRAMGIWEDTENVTFEEREQGVLWEVAAFVDTHYPDLMAPLRLQVPA